MSVTHLNLEGLLLITPKVFRDGRGYFYESHAANWIDHPFVQENHALSIAGTIRGLHYQSSPGQAKLVRVTRGKIWDVAVDIRYGSKTLGKWISVELSEENKQLLYIPIGYAHGYAVLSDVAEVQYKCSAPYNIATECGIRWDDPQINIKWPITNPILSDRDKNNTSFSNLKS